MANNHYTAATLRLCGHTSNSSFSSRRSNRLEDKLYFTNTVCGACRKVISESVVLGQRGFYQMELPVLNGSPRSASWAKSIRLTAIRSVGPTMLALSKASDEVSKAALAVYVMLFKIQSASFWIENQHTEFSGDWVVGEIEYLMRKPTTSQRPGALSVFLYWMTTNLAPIEEARVAIEELRAALIVEQTSAIAE